jgi:hypothetical protein
LAKIEALALGERRDVRLVLRQALGQLADIMEDIVEGACPDIAYFQAAVGICATCKTKNKKVS